MELANKVKKLSAHGVSDFRQIEIHTTELLVPSPSPFEVEIALQS
jgi:hypothetical protein